MGERRQRKRRIAGLKGEVEARGGSDGGTREGRGSQRRVRSL